jgi:hypothetical protein
MFTFPDSQDIPGSIVLVGDYLSPVVLKPVSMYQGEAVLPLVPTPFPLLLLFRIWVCISFQLPSAPMVRMWLSATKLDRYTSLRIPLWSRNTVKGF